MSIIRDGDYEFYSPAGGRINLGASKHKPAALNSSVSIGTQLLYHDNRDQTPFVPDKGLKTTKFHNGFDRRRASNITNIFSEKEKEYSEVRVVKVEKLAVARADRLNTLERTHGYNVITGELYGNVAPVVERDRRTWLGGQTSEAGAREAAVTLRMSDSRFFRPSPSGPALEFRQQQMRSEGLLKERRSGSLAGKSDLPSYGVEDQFSKSIYTPKTEEAMRGLVETCKPGAFNRNSGLVQSEGRIY